MDCLVIYIGNAYSENSRSYDGEYRYSVDIRDNFNNHEEKIFLPLREMGYNIHKAFLTNKHEKYYEFVNEFADVELHYDDINNEDFEIFKDYYFKIKNRNMHGPGSYWSGGRFQKLEHKLPEYDLYVILRGDTHFKVSIHDLNIDFDKMNWLWPETDINYFKYPIEEAREIWGSEFQFWDHSWRVNGNAFNIIPQKYINVFKTYFWADHMALYLMLNDLGPIISINDVNLMLGYDKCYTSDVRFCENPVYKLTKKILETGLESGFVDKIEDL